MKTVALIVVVAVLAMVGVEGRTVASDNGNNNNNTAILCPPLFVVGEDGRCEPESQYIADEIDAARRRRQATGTTCPYCALGIWDLYPDWSDCAKFKYCLNGDIIELDCRNIGGIYFNPTTKRCESVQQLSNSCLFRSFNLLTASQG